MHCFYHLDRDAVGGCKSCGKGVCPECAVDLGKGLACRGRCEEDARAVIQLIDRNIKLTATVAARMQGSQGVLSSTAIFHMITGVIFLAWGFMQDRTFIALLGGCFIAYGIFGLVKWRVVFQKPKTPGTP